MNKRGVQEKLFALWESKQGEFPPADTEALEVLIWQKKPNTAVKVTYKEKPRTWAWHDYGFTKVQYPDKWDAQYGIDLAVKKTLAAIARQIVEDENEE